MACTIPRCGVGIVHGVLSHGWAWCGLLSTEVQNGARIGPRNLHESCSPFSEVSIIMRITLFGFGMKKLWPKY